MNWTGYLKEFSEYLKLERAMSLHTHEAYLSDVEKLSQFLTTEPSVKHLSDIKPYHIQAFADALSGLEISGYTQARIISGIRAFFKFLHAAGQIAENPSNLTLPPKMPRKLPQILSPNEIDKMLNSIDLSKPLGTRNRAIIETLYSSGLRVSEVVNLKISGLYLENGYIKVEGKGRKERFVPIGRDATKFIKLYLAHFRGKILSKKGQRDFVFLKTTGEQLTRFMVFSLVKTLAKEVNIDKTVSPHTFRHSFATHLVENGADLRAVQEMLGHTSIQTTEIYTHLSMDYLRDVLEKFHPRSLTV